VKIPSTLTVDDLKDMIKQKKPNELKEIDAYSLDLFKVAVPDEDDLENRVKEAVAVDGMRPLKSTKELYQIFPDRPLKKTIHIAVKLPHGVGGSFALHTRVNRDERHASGASSIFLTVSVF
jgi:hypothetical protein